MAIGAHNVPEGFAVAQALVSKGATPSAAAAWAVATAAPQALAAVPAFAFCEIFRALHPLAMGFGAGAMMTVVFGEMLPEAARDAGADAAAAFATLATACFEGFRMTLDWASHAPDKASLLLAALAWSAAAGAATAVGGAVVFVAPRPTPAAEGGLLGFAGGVMLALALLDIALPAVADRGAGAGGPAVAGLSFAAGVGAVRALAAFLSGFDETALLGGGGGGGSAGGDEELGGGAASPKAGARAPSTARRAALVTLALAAHNAPEGLAVGVAAAHGDGRRAFSMALAIGLHNVPEGVAVATSVYLASRSRSRAFVAAACTGAVEPAAAVLSAALLSPFLEPAVLEASLLLVAGVMVAVSLGELAPAALRASRRGAFAGALGGWLVMRAGLAAVATLDGGRYE